MHLLRVAVIAGLKTLLCRGSALGITLLLFWIKGKQLKSRSDNWENFFLKFPVEKVQKCAVRIYLSAAAISSAISYIILKLTGSRHCLGIAGLLFTGGAVVTAYRWHTKGKEYLTKRYQEIPKTILEKQEMGTMKNE